MSASEPPFNDVCLEEESDGGKGGDEVNEVNDDEIGGNTIRAANGQAVELRGRARDRSRGHESDSEECGEYEQEAGGHGRGVSDRA